MATVAYSPTPLGGAIPRSLPHAISVSLPTWKDVVGYEEGEKRVVDSMCTGYPRFFINKMIQKLAIICQVKFGTSGELSLLFPTAKIAESCRKFMVRQSPNLPVRLVQFLISPEDGSEDPVILHVVFFPRDSFPLGKQFWQHTGLGISSRMAEKCLEFLSPREPALVQSIPISPVPQRVSRNKHYLVKGVRSPTKAATPLTEDITTEQTTYLEERYGRNLPRDDPETAKRTLRRRVAGILRRDSLNFPSTPSCEVEVEPSARRVENITEDDVFLFPTGMSSIWTAHQLALSIRPPAKSVCFGFPYTDTLKILQKWGPGCHFLGHGLDQDLQELETILETTPILALFCEFPSNPLLRSPDLGKLRELADKFDFLIICDETIGNFANVEVLPLVDMVVSSLTKVFSGETNVMGGGLVLNPHGRYYQALKQALKSTYEDSYWGEDAIFLERNSRDFQKRVQIINENAEAVCDFLRSHSLAYNHHHPPSSSSSASSSSSSSSSSHSQYVIKEVYYPKWVTRANYDAHRLPSGGFGGLFSMTFTSPLASQVFFDSLACEKGPSLGTNFTLACPYTILAHYLELDWAAGYGVESCLVRASVGLEEREVLLGWFREALNKATAAVKLHSVKTNEY